VSLCGLQIGSARVGETLGSLPRLYDEGLPANAC